jgi:uncharacterized protein YgiM (DUF1202 family)
MMRSLLFLAFWWAVIFAPSPFRRRLSNVFYLVFMSALLLYTGAATMRAYYDTWYPLQVVPRTMSMRMGPDDRYPVIAELAAGEKIRIMKKEGNWYKVQHEALHGWVPYE